jgi:hypothetical protein
MQWDYIRVLRKKAMTIVRPILGVSFHGPLHRNATIENYINKGCDRQCRVFTQEVPSKGALVLNEAFRMHVLKYRLFSDNKAI